MVLDLWWAGIWLKVSIFLSISWSQVKVSQLWASHWLKKRVISIFMKLVKRLYFCPDFCFLWIKCYFVITPMFTRMFTFWNVKSGFLTWLTWCVLTYIITISKLQRMIWKMIDNSNLSYDHKSLHMFCHYISNVVYFENWKEKFFVKSYY